MMPARFAQTNLGAVGFHREITLLDGATVEMPKIRRQSFQQEFPLDLTRDFAVAGLKVTGHNTIFSGPSGAGKPQPQRAAKREAHILSSRAAWRARDLAVGQNFSSLCEQSANERSLAFARDDNSRSSTEDRAVENPPAKIPSPCHRGLGRRDEHLSRF